MAQLRCQCRNRERRWTEYKVFNDPIHGHIEIHPLLVKIIDTPQFQRLRNIKQLGGAYFVFPGASHNRFEHSIGVGHLAGMLVEALYDRQKELDITERDILCVQIAGLCHDLGHGPFSHMFDGMFIPKARPDFKQKHESASLAMFDYLVRDNDVEQEMKEHGLVLPEDLVFIEELIDGPKKGGKQWPYEGRPEDKSFLYEIVANKKNGIDVDKWDYFARDCHHLGIQNNFDYRRFLKFARVCTVDGKKHICTRDKEVGNIYDLFYTRNYLHRRAYQHKVVNIVETMITEAFLLADQHLQFEGPKERIFTLSGAIDNMVAFTKVTDNVFEQILHSSSPDLVKARDMLHKIVCRDLYKCVGQTHVKDPTIKGQEGEEGAPGRNTRICICSPEGPQEGSRWAEEIVAARPPTEVDLHPEDLVVHIFPMDYGMKTENPMYNVWYYSKEDPDNGKNITMDQVWNPLQEHFALHVIQVFCKKTDKDILAVARECFNQWCSNNGIPTPHM